MSRVGSAYAPLHLALQMLGKARQSHAGPMNGQRRIALQYFVDARKGMSGNEADLLTDSQRRAL